MRAISAAEIAGLVGRPTPTDEQAAVIETLPGPGVVVAGAGSGKTETMAARVLWLVLNGHVRPEQVLGLTFTRKAAHELGDRIRRRLSQLRRHGVVSDHVLSSGDATVATYDSYAGRLVSEHALRLGEEPGRRLVTEAVAWQHATRVVEAYAGDMDQVDLALTTVVEHVLALHGELTGHLVDPAGLVAFSTAFDEAVRAVPDPVGRRPGPYADVVKALRRQQARLQLLPLVEAFWAEKRTREVLDFGDQTSLAATLAERFPEIGEVERSRFRVVLLDEYQDTSHSQLVMLRGLFGGGHPVTAVGDPCQSIYGWRGASAETLASFSRHFGATADAGVAAHRLSVSFRNRAGILRVANTLAADLGAEVPTLRAHDSTPDQVVVALHETVDDEAADLARRVRAEWDAGASAAAPPSIAVLVRKRAQIERLVTALRDEGLPVEVLGVGGLLMTPEVSDVVATLQVISDPRRGDALMRLLTGARWRIGPRDLDALGRWARRLVHLRSGDGAPADLEVAPPGTGAIDDAINGARTEALNPSLDDTLDIEPDEVDERSIIDALDTIPAHGWFSALGRARLTALATQLRALRTRVAQPLPDLVSEVIHVLQVDIEVSALVGSEATGRANLDAFLDVAAAFGESGEESSLSAFLAYLAAAESEERGLAPGEVEVSDRAVQVLTVHGAKGLEWDMVCVPGLVTGTFPAGGDSDKAWLQDLGSLPFPLRGDRAGLPMLELSGLRDQREVNQAFTEFALACGELGRTEERRLAYVAVTRARRHLVCSGYRWGTTVRPLEPSPFLEEIRAACEAGAGAVGIWAAPPADSTSNPVTAEPLRSQWPYDPLARRRREVEAGAERVARAMLRDDMTLLPTAAGGQDRWSRDVGLLLAERARRARTREVHVALPGHLSVSQLVLLGRDPEALARSLRRPLPSAPNPLARRGTAFHAWVEGRWGAPRLVDDYDLPGAADEGAAGAEELVTLQQAFLASPWADRTPVEVEAPFELLLDGLLLRGRADAVFAAADGSLDVVDWKTGAPPRDALDLAARSVQLAAYRVAWARLYGVPLDRVRAAFHHVREGLTIAPVDLLDEDGLVELVRSVPAA